MKILKVFKKEGVEEYRLTERPETYPQEFVKDIIYKNGNFTVVFSYDADWFKSFVNMPCEYIEFNEEKSKSNKEKLQ